MKKYKDFLGEDISANGFSLSPRDAHQTVKNINLIFMARTGWFSKPPRLHIWELKQAYIKLVPDMEIHFPGVINQIFQPEILKKLGYTVDETNMVHWSK